MLTPDAINEMLQRVWPGARARCEAVGPESARMRFVPRAEDMRPGGTFSGPAQFAAADAAFWFLVCGVLDRAEPMALTSELSIRFLRRARGDTLHAEATLERAGRRLVVATVRVWTDDRDHPCATAQGTYTLPQAPS